MKQPTYEDVLDAVSRVRRFLSPTPLIEWPGLSKLLGCRFFLKHENHTSTTAFKVRGGINLVSRLSEDERRRGILGCTTGNHGQSLAFACRQFGVRCVLVVPARNNPDKVSAMRNLGAEIVEFGRDFDEARDHCDMLASKEGYRYVHSANEPDLIAGVGTLYHEIFEALPDPDVLFVPIGLGSGMAGAGLVAKAVRPETRIIGVQAERAPAVIESWRQQRWVELPDAPTFAEGVATRRPAELTLEMMNRDMDDAELVSEEEMRRAILWILRFTHNLAEGAGAASTAAAWKRRHQYQGKKVVAVLSGGNLDLRVLRELLAQTESNFE